MKKPLMEGPKKQFNVRMPVQLLRDLDELASARGMRPSAVFLALLEEAVRNCCRRCRGGLAPGSTVFRPKACPFCFGTGRRDLAKAERRARKAMGSARPPAVGQEESRRPGDP